MAKITNEDPLKENDIIKFCESSLHFLYKNGSDALVDKMKEIVNKPSGVFKNGKANLYLLYITAKMFDDDISEDTIYQAIKEIASENRPVKNKFKTKDVDLIIDKIISMEPKLNEIVNKSVLTVLIVNSVNSNCGTESFITDNGNIGMILYTKENELSFNNKWDILINLSQFFVSTCVNPEITKNYSRIVQTSYNSKLQKPEEIFAAIKEMLATGLALKIDEFNNLPLNVIYTKRMKTASVFLADKIVDDICNNCEILLN